jgi:serine/threonine-protein kinase HipA
VVDEAAIAGIIRGLTNAPLGAGIDPEFRISLAGAQEKTALLLQGDQWCAPIGATPSTHIFKLPMGLVGNMRADMSASVENEWLCLRLLRALGLPVATSGMGRFGRHKVLVVERFDRLAVAPADAPPWLARLPQEDFCQAIGIAGHLKYEPDGGPGLRAILRVLQASSHSQADVATFILAQLAFWLLAATDGHAKNFSIFLERGGRYRLTPLYDVLSVWPIIGDGPNQLPFRRAKLAMALRSRNTHYHLHEIQARHWRALARESGVAFSELIALVERLADALAKVAGELPDTFPPRVWDTIRVGCETQARRFLGGIAEA